LISGRAAFALELTGCETPSPSLGDSQVSWLFVGGVQKHDLKMRGVIPLTAINGPLVKPWDEGAAPRIAKEDTMNCSMDWPAYLLFGIAFAVVVYWQFIKPNRSKKKGDAPGMSESKAAAERDRASPPPPSFKCQIEQGGAISKLAVDQKMFSAGSGKAFLVTFLSPPPTLRLAGNTDDFIEVTGQLTCHPPCFNKFPFEIEFDGRTGTIYAGLAQLFRVRRNARGAGQHRRNTGVLQ
jgi:hypothetical protein